MKHRRNGVSPYNHVFDFQMDFEGQRVQMSFTSVSGHLMSTDFEERLRKWGSCDPLVLLNENESNIRWFVPEEKDPLKATLHREARTAALLVLWLDCDSEGEKIAYDVMTVVKAAKQSIRVKRAKFSSLTPRDLYHAVNNLVQIDQRVVDMVSTRQEIDLRAGAAFTRFLTTFLTSKYQISEDEKEVISYGPCQFPTLGLIVDRYLTVENFVRRPFHVIELRVVGTHVGFSWHRGRIFDEYSAHVIYELCHDQLIADDDCARITGVNKRQRKRWRPLPLSTVELQKAASRILRMTSHATMEAAERLYNAGLLSYPRTETDRFDRNYDLKNLVRQQTGHPEWGSFASRLLDTPQNGQGIAFQWPRAGANDDGAHPPIHPTKSAPSSFENEAQRKVFTYVTKRFLASCSIDAVGSETRVELTIEAERFGTTGLIIEEHGYLEIMRGYERWGEQEMPRALLNQGGVIKIAELNLRRSLTQPPPLLAEADLIALMDRHGIGTDATIAEHIKKVQDRRYVQVNNQNRFEPLVLGLALVEAYERGGVLLARPTMRAEQERDLKMIGAGTRQSVDVRSRSLHSLRGLFARLRNNQGALEAAFSQRFQRFTAANWHTERTGLCRCGDCGGGMNEKVRGNENRTPRQRESTRGRGSENRRGRGRGRNVRGSNRRRRGGTDAQVPLERALECPQCHKFYHLPRNGRLDATDFTCILCSFQVIESTNWTSGTKHTFCPKCYNEPPDASSPAISANPLGKGSGEFRCFMCSAPGCALASQFNVCACPSCQSSCTLRQVRHGQWLIGCSGEQSRCKWTYFFPKPALLLSVSVQSQRNSVCSSCNSKLLTLKWNHRNIPASASRVFNGCIWCSPDYRNVLYSIGERERIPRQPHPGQSNNRRQNPGQYQTRGARGAVAPDIESMLTTGRSTGLQSRLRARRS